MTDPEIGNKNLFPDISEVSSAEPAINSDVLSKPSLTHNLMNGLLQTKMARVGVAAFTALGISASIETGLPEESNAKKSLNCDLGSIDHNSYICGFSRPDAVRRCLKNVRREPHNFKASFKESTSTVRDYTVGFRVEGMLGCDPIGDRKLSLVRMLRKGKDGEFESDSDVVTIRSNRNTTVKRELGDTIKCTPDMKGSAVKTELRASWEPIKGWPVPKGAKNLIVRSTNPKPIC